MSENRPFKTFLCVAMMAFALALAIGAQERVRNLEARVAQLESAAP